MYQTLTLTRDNKVATVTLNRPEMRNAFNETTIAEITQVFKDLSDDSSVRAVVLAANGPAFCAGADLNWMKKMADYTHAENLADAGNWRRCWQRFIPATKPVGLRYKAIAMRVAWVWWRRVT